MKAKSKNKQKPEHERIFSFISEAGMLMQMPRSHQRHLGNTFDTVSSHSHHTAVIAYCLVRMEGLSHEEGLKAVTIGTFHDLAEARTSDLDFVAKHYAQVFEDKAIERQYSPLPFGEDLKALIEEYEERETLTSKCVKDADALDQMYQEWVLAHTGNSMAKRWWEGDYKNRVPSLRTKSAKKLAKAMKKVHPQSWWFEDYEEKNLDLSLLNGKK